VERVVGSEAGTLAAAAVLRLAVTVEVVGSSEPAAQEAAAGTTVRGVTGG
jgi:hypothetical protein